MPPLAAVGLDRWDSKGVQVLKPAVELYMTDRQGSVF